jgi:hypothetical protein
LLGLWTFKSSHPSQLEKYGRDLTPTAERGRSGSDSYSSKSKVQNIAVSRVLLSGSFALSPKLKEFIRSSLHDDICFIDHKVHGTYDASTIEAYCIPIGLALDTIKMMKTPCNFRQKVFFKKAFQKKVKSLSVYFYCCAALALSMFVLGKVHVSKGENLFALCQHYFPEYGNLGNIHQQIASIEKKLAKGKKKSSLSYPSSQCL